MRSLRWLGFVACFISTAVLADPPIYSLAPDPGVDARPSPHAEQAALHAKESPVPFQALGPVEQTSGPPRVSRRVLGFLPYWTNPAQIRWDLLTELLWFRVDARSDGSLLNDKGWPDNSLIAEAHANGVSVSLVITCFNASRIATILNSATARQRLIDEAIDLVLLGGADGVNIDFEGVPASVKNQLSSFMQDLTQRFHAEIPGSIVTIDTPAVDWDGAFDYDVLAEGTDGLMIMAYGYHWSGSSHAGASASLRGESKNIEWTVADYLEWGKPQNRHKFILGLPWYGRDWPVSSHEMGAPTTGSGSAVTFSVAKGKAQQYGEQWDGVSVAAWYNYWSGSQRHQAWFDNGESLYIKHDYVNQQDLGGIGIWALGYDGSEPELWQAIEDAFVPASGTAAIR